MKSTKRELVDLANSYLSRDRQCGYFCFVFSGENHRGCTVTTAHVADSIAGLDSDLFSDQAGQLQNRLFPIFFAGFPITMMHVSAPDRSVKKIEIVIVCSYCRNIRDRLMRRNHRLLVLHRSFTILS